MKQNIFFTADHHFGHANIIKFSERPFESLEHMNEELIKRWNEKIGKDDTVYHLGDFSLGKPDFTKEILDRLNGNIHLIKGNHEGAALTYPKRFASIRDYHELRIDEADNSTVNKKLFFFITPSEHGTAHTVVSGNYTAIRTEHCRMMKWH